MTNNIPWINDNLIKTAEMLLQSAVFMFFQVFILDFITERKNGKGL